MTGIPLQNSGFIMHFSVAIKVSYCEAITRWPPVSLRVRNKRPMRPVHQHTKKSV